MTQQTSSDCTQDTNECGKDPAPQPPSGTDDCQPLDEGRKPPCYTPPPECKTCCTCPPGGGGSGTCLDGLIKQEADAVSKGERAKKFKTELEALLGKVKAATLDYTADSYKDLVERWKQEDEAIVCLIRSIKCALPCWWCVIECELCPLLNDIVKLESKLSGEFKTCDGPEQEQSKQSTTTEGEQPCLTSLYDLRHWWWREKLRRTALFDHVASVMRAWETPFKTIDGILKANADIIKAATAALGIDQKKDASKILFDVFFRLVPQHMAIAPRQSPETTTGIAKKYLELCCCDNSPTLHDCCGVIIRLPTVRDRIIGPLPYLIPPAQYANLICCLAQNVYQPAKDQAAEAESQYGALDTEVKAIEAAIPAQLKSLAVDAKTRMSKTIECKDYQPTKSDTAENSNA
jgi:hypothetical protein